jgi:hypothetical protein
VGVARVWHRLRGVGALVEAAEAAGGFEYDWLVRARTDVVVTAALDLAAVPQGYIYVGG